MAGSNLFTGTLDLLILKALEKGPLHGYAIGRWIRDTGGGPLQVEEGALYPALHRLQKARLLSADWGQTETGRQAKFYELTAAGREQLAAETARWNEHADAVAAVLSAERGA
ncbi:MAG: PadR family transcriptional regulator [Acidobacteriota bacterium]|jgi:transcriptional regulator